MRCRTAIGRTGLFEGRQFTAEVILWADGFQVANPLNQFAIGDRDPLKYNRDGSLDLYIQHEDPGRDY